MQTIAEVLEAARRHGSIARAAIAWQAAQDGTEETPVRNRMLCTLEVMRQSVTDGLEPALRSVSGRVGGQAAHMVAPEQAAALRQQAH